MTALLVLAAHGGNGVQGAACGNQPTGGVQRRATGRRQLLNGVIQPAQVKLAHSGGGFDGHRVYSSYELRGKSVSRSGGRECPANRTGGLGASSQTSCPRGCKCRVASSPLGYFGPADQPTGGLHGAASAAEFNKNSVLGGCPAGFARWDVKQVTGVACRVKLGGGHCLTPGR